MKQLLSALLLLSGYLAYSQPYALDFTFNPGTGTMYGTSIGQVASIFVESNGQIIVGGGFETFNGQSLNGVARLNSDGSVDTNFFVGQGPGPEVSAVAAQTNGMILIGGSFNSVNGVDQQSLARLRIDGSLDINFTPNIQTLYGIGISSILQQPNGNILIAGNIDKVDGEAMWGIARLTFNGALDGTFFPALTSGEVSSMALDASGNILVAGQIDIGTNQLYVARLASDGSQDTSFSIGEIDGNVNRIGVEPNGEIVVTGGFSEINGYSRVGIAELLPDGQVDTSFRPNPETNYGTLLSIEADGQILTTGNGKLMRVNTDGSVDTTFNPNVSGVECLTIQPNGRLLIGGSFSQVNQTNINGIARLQGDSLAPFQTQLLNVNFYAGMQINGNVGTSYRVESATNLAQPSPWTPLSTFNLTTTPYWFLDTNPISSGASRFYRAVILPP